MKVLTNSISEIWNGKYGSFGLVSKFITEFIVMDNSVDNLLMFSFLYYVSVWRNGDNIDILILII